MFIDLCVYLFQRIPLDFLTGDKFREAADNYMRPLLTKVTLFCIVCLTSYLCHEVGNLQLFLIFLREFRHCSLIFLRSMINLKRFVKVFLISMSASGDN